MRPTAHIALIACCLALGACADGDGGTLFIAGIVEPDEECQLPANPQEFRSSGRVNLDLATGFTLTPLVANGVAPDVAVLNDGTADASTLNIIGADVSLLDVNDDLLPGFTNPYFVPASGVVPGNGFQPIAFTAIPQSVLNELDGNVIGLAPGSPVAIVVATKLRGRTAGGDSVISPEHQYTLNLILGGACPDGFTVGCAGGDEEATGSCPRFGQDRTALLSSEICIECGASGVGAITCCP